MALSTGLLYLWLRPESRRHHGRFAFGRERLLILGLHIPTSRTLVEERAYLPINSLPSTYVSSTYVLGRYVSSAFAVPSRCDVMGATRNELDIHSPVSDRRSPMTTHQRDTVTDVLGNVGTSTTTSAHCWSNCSTSPTTLHRPNNSADSAATSANSPPHYSPTPPPSTATAPTATAPTGSPPW